MRKTLEIRGWRPRICKFFEITITIYSNSERSEQFLLTNAFLSCCWRFLRSNELEKLEFKLEKIIGIEICRKVRKCTMYIPDNRPIQKSYISSPLSQLQTLGKTTTTIVTTSPPDQSLENGQGLFVQSTKLSLSSNSSSATLSSKQKKKW